MSKPSFTPGPWTIVRLKDGDFDSYVVGHKRGGITKMILCSDYQKETSDANAHLIAAAPELYEALVLLEAEMVASGNAQSTDYGWKPAIEKTRSALAKARGETQ